MKTLAGIRKKYFHQVDFLDLDLIISEVIKKPREFVLAHPEYKLTTNQQLKTTNYVARRMKNEPLAYILGHKEFYGLDFKVTRDTLIPRPETELIVEEVLKMDPKNKNIIDVGTGSGNIIISLAKNLQEKNDFIAIDLSKEALKIAQRNAKKNLAEIKFLHGNLLDKINDINNSIIIANLPYLSKEIYGATLPNVKKYEPKSALYSSEEGLVHYRKLLQQISELKTTNHKLQTTILLEISPEQKAKLPRIIKSYLPKAKIEFQKDLAKKWRICKIEI